MVPRAQSISWPDAQYTLYLANGSGVCPSTLLRSVSRPYNVWHEVGPSCHSLGDVHWVDTQKDAERERAYLYRVVVTSSSSRCRRRSRYHIEFVPVYYGQHNIPKWVYAMLNARGIRNRCVFTKIRVQNESKWSRNIYHGTTRISSHGKFIIIFQKHYL